MYRKNRQKYQLFMQDMVTFLASIIINIHMYSLKRQALYTFIEIQPVVLAITEIQRKCTIKHTTMPNNVLHDSVHHNHHQAPLLQNFKKPKSVCNMQFHALFYMFQQQIAILRETSVHRNIKLIHPVYIYNVKNK